MDAHALLTKQGWRGTGNSLHPTSNSIGLAKPLLVGRKNDKVGLGKKAHQTSDMWWMHAFDESLKSLDTTHEGNMVRSVASVGGRLDAVKRGAGKWVLANGGLYANFVKGTGLAGTIIQMTNKMDIVNDGSIAASNEASSTTKKNRSKLVSGEQMRNKDDAKPIVSRLKKSKENRYETKQERRTRKLEKRLLHKQCTAESKSHISEDITRSVNLVTDKKKRSKKSVEQKAGKISQIEPEDLFENKHMKRRNK